MANATVDKAKAVVRKVRDKVQSTQAFDRTLYRRVAALEAQLESDRQLHRKIAELSDVVAELLIPIQNRDDKQVRETLAKYRKSI